MFALKSTDLTRALPEGDRGHRSIQVGRSSHDVWASSIGGHVSISTEVAYPRGLLNELPRIVKRPLLPGARKLAESIASFEPVVRWFGHHVLGVSGPLVKEYPAGNDFLLTSRGFHWVQEEGSNR